MIGGGMRQAGIMAAAGIVALEQMVGRLREDHEHAKVLAKGLVDLGLEVDMETVQTNIVFFRVPPLLLEPSILVEKLKNKGILIGSPRGNRIRMVTHKDVTREDIGVALDRFRDVMRTT